MTTKAEQIVKEALEGRTTAAFEARLTAYDADLKRRQSEIERMPPGKKKIRALEALRREVNEMGGALAHALNRDQVHRRLIGR